MTSASRTVSYDVRVDWALDGYGGVPDDISCDVLAGPGMEIEYGRDAARSFAPPMVSAARLAVDNNDRTYSPEFAGSPLYQSLRPGRPVRIQASSGTADAYRAPTAYRETDPYRGTTVYPLFVGALDTIEQRPNWGDRSVAMTFLGSAATLLRKVIAVPVYQSITTGQAVGLALDAAGWPAALRSIAIGETQLRWWWAEERPCWDALVEVLASEGAGAMLYEDTEGVIHFENRNWRLSSLRSTTVQAIFSDLSDGTPGPPPAELWYADLRYTPHWEDVVGRVTMPITQRVLDASPSVVWKLGTPYSMNVIGQPNVITARPSDPFLAAIAPAAGTDYTVSGGTATVALSSSDGRVARITLTATSGSPVVSNLQLRAQALRSVGDTIIEASPQDPPYDKTLELRGWPEIDPNHAQSVLNSIYARYGNSIPRIEVDVVNGTPAHVRACLGLRISDRVTIKNRHLGLDRDCYIEAIRHSVRAGGLHVTTFSCEVVTAVGGVGGAVWDAAVWNAAVWGV